MGEAIGPVSIGSGRVPGDLVRGDDPLPTAEAVRRVTDMAERITAQAALGTPKTAKLVAHAALSRLCPQVRPARIAAMLFISPGVAMSGRLAAWVAEAAAEIVTSIQGEG